MGNKGKINGRSSQMIAGIFFMGPGIIPGEMHLSAKMRISPHSWDKNWGGEFALSKY
jgi:hypothetical protein